MQTGPVLARRQRPRRAPHGRRGIARNQQLRDRHGPPDCSRPLILADHCHVHNAVNARDERAAERCQKVSAVERTHIAPEQVQKHPPWKRKKPDKEQTFQSAPYPAAVSLNSSLSDERRYYARASTVCQAVLKKLYPAHTRKIQANLYSLGGIRQESTGPQVHTGRSPYLPRLHREI